MTKKPVYREAIKEAWFLTWRNTSLWLIGLISALFAGSFGLSNFFAQLAATMTTGGRAGWILDFYAPNLGVNKISAIFWLLWLCGVIIILALAIVYVSTAAKATLLISVADYYKKKALPKLSEAWNRGIKFFWKIFTIEIFRKVALCLIGLMFGFIWILLPFQNGIICAVIDIIVLTLCVILAWIVTTVSVFASGYAVIDGKSLRHALKRAWQLFHEHLFASFEVGIILTLIDITLLFALIAVVWAAFVPSLFVWIIAGIFGSQILAAFGVILGFILLALIIAIAGGIYNTFYTSVWMYLFMKMHHEGITSRFFHHFVNWFKGK